MENAEALLETYSASVQAVTDLKWLADRVCEVCVDIAHTQDDVSYLLPDRWQVSNACLPTMEAAMTPIAVRDALLDAFRIAVERCDDPRDVLSKAFADVMNRVDGDASHRIADVIAQASQDGVRKMLDAALSTATRIVDDRRWIVDILLKELSRSEANGDPPYSDEELPDSQLFRAFLFSATALGDPAEAASLLATIHLENGRQDFGAEIDHMVSTFVRVLPALDDPKTETALLYGAYGEIIDYDTADAVESLVDAARSAIAGAADFEATFRVLLDGLTVQPAGWPPPTFSWLRME